MELKDNGKSRQEGKEKDTKNILWGNNDRYLTGKLFDKLKH